VLLPVALREFVADQLVGGGRVGDAQQRLGDAHEEHAFLRGKVVFPQERLHAAVALLAVANLLHQGAGARLHARRRLDGQRGGGEELGEGLRFIAQVGVAHSRDERRDGLVHAPILPARERR
jgi:hypothetical protein